MNFSIEMFSFRNDCKFTSYAFPPMNFPKRDPALTDKETIVLSPTPEQASINFPKLILPISLAILQILTSNPSAEASIKSPRADKKQKPGPVIQETNQPQEDYYTFKIGKLLGINNPRIRTMVPVIIPTSPYEATLILCESEEQGMHLVLETRLEAEPGVELSTMQMHPIPSLPPTEMGAFIEKIRTQLEHYGKIRDTPPGAKSIGTTPQEIQAAMHTFTRAQHDQIRAVLIGESMAQEKHLHRIHSFQFENESLGVLLQDPETKKCTYVYLMVSSEGKAMEINISLGFQETEQAAVIGEKMSSQIDSIIRKKGWQGRPSTSEVASEQLRAITPVLQIPQKHTPPDSRAK